MEYRNAGDLEAAMAEFRELIGCNPDYATAYFHGGQTLERLGRLEEAAEMYRRARGRGAKGRSHARGELQGALDFVRAPPWRIVKFGPWRSLASALAWGARGPEFKSRRPDQPSH